MDILCLAQINKYGSMKIYIYIKFTILFTAGLSKIWKRRVDN